MPARYRTYWRELPVLTRRQLRVLALIAEGQTNEQIAATLGCKYETVKSHAVAILDRLDAFNRAHAVALGLARGFIEPCPPDQSDRQGFRPRSGGQ